MKKMENSNLKKLFDEAGKTLGSIESFTGGLFASEITSISGASSFFKGSVVTYATEEKVKVVGVSQEVVDKFGVVSKECAEEMATKGSKVLDVDYCISFTGNAGPTAMEGKPVGLVYIGVFDGEKCHVLEKNIIGTRNFVRNEAILIACDFLESIISKK